MPRFWLVPALVAALALAALVYIMNENDSSSTPTTPLPPDPAGRRAALLAALAGEGITGEPARILLAQAILETANFTSRAFGISLSPWNRHVGSGKYGEWNGHVCMDGTLYDSDAAALAVDPTNAREHLRCFDDLGQAVRDMQGLLGLSLYAEANRQLLAGNMQGYAAAITNGDGHNGFVGPVNTPKAAGYITGLTRTYGALHA